MATKMAKKRKAKKKTTKKVSKGKARTRKLVAKVARRTAGKTAKAKPRAAARPVSKRIAVTKPKAVVPAIRSAPAMGGAAAVVASNFPDLDSSDMGDPLDESFDSDEDDEFA